MGLNDRIVGGQVGGDGKGPESNGPIVTGLTRERVEAAFDRQSELKSSIHTYVIRELGPRLYNQSLPEMELRRLVRGKIEEALVSDHTPLARGERQELVEELMAEVLGYGPIEEFLRDPTVTEVMVNGYQRHLHRARRQAATRPRNASATKATSAASSRRSSARWAGGWTSLRLTSMPACPTAPE